MRTGTAFGILLGGLTGLAIAYACLQGFMETSRPRARALSFDNTAAVVVRGTVASVDRARGYFDVQVSFPGYAQGELPFRISFEAVDQFIDRTVAASLDGSPASLASLVPGQLISLRIKRETGQFHVSSAVAQAALSAP